MISLFPSDVLIVGCRAPGWYEGKLLAKKSVINPPPLGETVHFVLPPESPRKGEIRAAIVTSVFPGQRVNLTVFLDQRDDLETRRGIFATHARAWTVPFDPDGKAPGTWHFPAPSFPGPVQ